jgi:hypothetical protein
MLKQNTMRSLINKYNTGLDKTPCVLSFENTIQAKTKHHVYSH